MTYLQLVNSVLVRLRLGEVSGVSSTPYSALIGQLVNEAKREVEDAWDWIALESGPALSLDPGVGDSYTVTGLGRRGKVKRVWNTGTVSGISQYELIAMNTYQFQELWNAQPSGATGRPAYWRLQGLDGDDPIMQFYPSPDIIYNVKIKAFAPQADLEMDDDEMTVPHWPVLLGAYALAVAERGDDRGNPVSMAQLAYQSALSDAIAIDNGNKNAGRDTDWVMDPRWR